MDRDETERRAEQAYTAAVRDPAWDGGPRARMIQYVADAIALAHDQGAVAGRRGVIENAEDPTFQSGHQRACRHAEELVANTGRKTRSGRPTRSLAGRPDPTVSRGCARRLGPSSLGRRAAQDGLVVR